jgi:hypothetical protein
LLFAASKLPHHLEFCASLNDILEIILNLHHLTYDLLEEFHNAIF